MNSRIVILLTVLIFCSNFIFGQKLESFSASNDFSKSVALYPNPTTDYISVLFENPDARTSQLVLYTIIGNEVMIEPEVVDENEVRIKVRELPSGYYLLAIRNEKFGLRLTRKFLKR